MVNTYIELTYYTIHNDCKCNTTSNNVYTTLALNINVLNNIDVNCEVGMVIAIHVCVIEIYTQTLMYI